MKSVGGGNGGIKLESSKVELEVNIYKKNSALAKEMMAIFSAGRKRKVNVEEVKSWWRLLARCQNEQKEKLKMLLHLA